MNQTFSEAAAEFAALAVLVPSDVMGLYSDIVDSAAFTAIRAEFVLNLYTAAYKGNSQPARQSALSQAYSNIMTVSFCFCCNSLFYILIHRAGAAAYVKTRATLSCAPSAHRWLAFEPNLLQVSMCSIQHCPLKSRSL